MTQTNQLSAPVPTAGVRRGPAMMKALVARRYGAPDVVELADVPMPLVGARDVLIRVHASTVSSGDWRARALALPPGFRLLGRLFFGVFRPRRPVLGTELAGVVEAVGRSVTRFQPGDEVFAFPGGAYGSHAEYRAMPESGLIAKKPASLTFEQAAALSFGGTAALSFLRDKGRIQRGDRVLVVGASGAVGTAAVQLARHFGAHVTGVCSTANVELVRSLGASHVIDYTQEDFAKNGETYDLIVDTTATVPLSRCEQSLKPNGRLLVVQGSLAQAFGWERPSRGSGKAVIAGLPRITADDLGLLADLAAQGACVPVIDQVYPWSRAVEAHALVDTGRKRGSVVLTIDRGGRS